MDQTRTVPDRTGWLEEDFDSADLYYEAPVGLVVKSSVDLWKEHQNLAVTVYDQGQIGSCVANAVAAAFSYEAKKQGVDAMASTGGPSRLFIYWNARVARMTKGTIPGDDGTQNRYAIRSLDKIGVSAENTWPYDEKKVSTAPGAPAFSEAENHTIDAYFRLDPDRPANKDANLNNAQKDKLGEIVLERLRKCLSEGFPVVFGFRYYWEYIPFDESSKDGIWQIPDIWAAQPPLSPRHMPPRQDWGGHTVLAIGYDDNRRLVLCQNSWGVKKPNSTFQSKDGLFTIPYSWITDFRATNDFWMIRKERDPAVAHRMWTDFEPELEGIQEHAATEGSG